MEELTKKQEREFNQLFNEFIEGDGMYLPDQMAYRYFYIRGLNSKFK